MNVEHSTLNIERRMEKIRYWFSSLEVESWKFDVGCSFSEKDERPTFNTQHRTSNEKDSIFVFFPLEVESWKFDVGCSSSKKSNIKYSKISLMGKVYR